MNHAIRIAVADDEQDMREYLQEVLQRMGHEVICAAQSGRELVEQCKNAHPDLVITDIKMSDMDGLDAAQQLYRDGPIPVIAVSAYHDPDLIQRAEQNHILAYLVKPIKEEDLKTAIAIAMVRFQEFRTLRKETADLRQALEDRKIIERAKGILMKYARLDEPEAFRRLQRLASEKNLKLVEIARTILTAVEAFQSADDKK